MTVTSETISKSYAGDDATTSFATSPVKFYDDADLKVYVIDDESGDATLLTLDSNYTVSGGDGSTGTVNLAGGGSAHGALLDDTTLIIYRDVARTQPSDYQNNEVNDADVLEESLDRLTMMVQTLNDRVGRSLRLPDTDTSGTDMALPTPVADALIAFNSDADGLTTVLISEIAAPGVVDIVNVADVTLTLSAAHNQKVVRMTNGGTVTVPADLEIGHTTGIISGSGEVAVTAGAGATLNVAATFTATLFETNSYATVLCTAADTWLIVGDLKFSA